MVGPGWPQAHVRTSVCTQSKGRGLRLNCFENKVIEVLCPFRNLYNRDGMSANLTETPREAFWTKGIEVRTSEMGRGLICLPVCWRLGTWRVMAEGREVAPAVPWSLGRVTVAPYLFPLPALTDIITVPTELPAGSHGRPLPASTPLLELLKHTTALLMHRVSPALFVPLAGF